MVLTNKCRLCLSENELFWIFDKNLQCTDNIQEVILLTLGVQMSEDDVVSQKVCSQCFKVVLTMYAYRERAIKADLYLKAQYKQLIENTALHDKLQKNILNNTTESLIKPKTSSEDCDKKNQHIEKSPEAKQVHPSIIKVLLSDPNIKIPESCVTFNIDPKINLEIDDNINRLLQQANNVSSCNKIPDPPQRNAKIQVSSIIIDRSNVNRKFKLESNEGNWNVCHLPPVESTYIKNVAKDDKSNEVNTAVTQTLTSPIKLLETDIFEKSDSDSDSSPKMTLETYIYKITTDSDSSSKKTLLSVGGPQIAYPKSPSFLERLENSPKKTLLSVGGPQIAYPKSPSFLERLENSPKKTLLSVGGPHIAYPKSPSFLERLGNSPKKTLFSVGGPQVAYPKSPSFLERLENSPKKTLFSVGGPQVAYPKSPSFLERLGLVKNPIENKFSTYIDKKTYAMRTHRQKRVKCKFCFERIRHANNKEKHEKMCKSMATNSKLCVRLERLKYIDELLNSNRDIDNTHTNINNCVDYIGKSTETINNSTSTNKDFIIVKDNEDIVSPTTDFPVSTLTKHKILDKCSPKIISAVSPVATTSKKLNDKS